MKKVSIIYWSNGGNVEVLADRIFKGAKEEGATVVVKHVHEATLEDVTSADAVAFGSPSMDNNRIEQEEMEPFIKQFELISNENKDLVLFGSFGWDNGEFMKEWSTRMQGYGFNLIDTISVKEAPSQKELEEAINLGKILAK
ncbi:flavodoxin [Clostridium algidicarnis]|uniref:flavodoxin n=1 Tax=Clostridium algidicarnis TaxID=37659 RepID=UPI001C0BCE19|nr:flavodoxin [Clostridium algidicarnis]MBU3208889.1 flavodoxin [Clostridium algidicarnis]